MTDAAQVLFTMEPRRCRTCRKIVPLGPVVCCEGRAAGIPVQYACCLDCARETTDDPKIQAALAAMDAPAWKGKA